MPLTLSVLSTLQIRTPRLSLRIPSDADIEDLLSVARAGIHDPSEMPFSTAWTDAPEADFDDQFRSFHQGVRDTWATSNWDFEFVVSTTDGRVIGTQGLAMRGMPPGPETGSWLGRAFQGQGYGTQMRSAVLAFAFQVLELDAVTSGAFAFNAASLAVSRKLGYRETHRTSLAPRGEPQESIRLQLDRATWQQQTPRVPVEIVADPELACQLRALATESRS